MTPPAAWHPSFLRSITTVHARDSTPVEQEGFWRGLLPTWTFLAVRDGAGTFMPRMERVISRLNPDARQKALAGHVLLLEDVDRPSPNECLISIDPHSREVTVRIFGRFLTDIQSTSEWFIHRLLDAQESFIITPHTRCFVLMDVHGERTDLTTGRVVPGRHRLWQGFYREHVYSLNITAAVLLVTLGVVIFVSPAGVHSPLGKVYGICERVLSAALMNAFLLLGQFYSYRQGRRVVEWEKP